MRLPLLVIFSFWVVNSVFACDCIMYPVQSYIDTSEYIILAKTERVTQEKGMPNMHHASMSVTRIFKGGLKKGEIVDFGSDGSDCSLRFEENKEYLLFCFKMNGKFYVYPCSYSDESKVSQKNIRKIEKYIFETSRRHKQKRQ